MFKSSFNNNNKNVRKKVQSESILVFVPSQIGRRQTKNKLSALRCAYNVCVRCERHARPCRRHRHTARTHARMVCANINIMGRSPESIVPSKYRTVGQTHSYNTHRIPTKTKLYSNYITLHGVKKIWSALWLTSTGPAVFFFCIHIHIILYLVSWSSAVWYYAPVVCCDCMSVDWKCALIQCLKWVTDDNIYIFFFVVNELIRHIHIFLCMFFVVMWIFLLNYDVFECVYT